MESEKQSQYKKGLWTEEEDRVLLEYVRVHGRGQWNRIPKITGLKRCGKSCRLRWLNYLSPNVKRGDFSQEEDDLIIRLHKLLGNRWSLIAGRVPGRTDNQVKNHWNTHLCKNNPTLHAHLHKPTFKSSKRRHSRATTNVAAASSSRSSQDNNNIGINIGDEKVENGGINVGGGEEEEEGGGHEWMGSCVFSATKSSSSADSLYYYLNSDDFVEYGYPLDLVWKGF